MTRPRVALGLEASRATLDRAACLRIGRQLAGARERLGLNVQSVATSLLLSPAQVKALEAVEPEAFYGADFYAKALKKYATLVGVESDLIERALVAPASTGDDSPPPFLRGRTAAQRASASTAVPPPRKPVILAVALLVTVLGGWLLVSSARRQSPSLGDDTDRSGVPVPLSAPPPLAPPPPAPAPIATVSPAAPAVVDVPTSVPEPSTAEAIEPLRAATDSQDVVGHVKVAAPTWVFVRYGDNSTAERSLGPGQEFVLSRIPVYLVVGVAEGADVVIGGRTLDSSRFATNGQLRVGASQLASLATDRR